MKLTDIVTEITVWSVLNDRDSDYAPRILRKAANAPQLKCNLKNEALKSATCEKTNMNLLRNFEAACEGKYPRWRLVQVRIACGRLYLIFADMGTSLSQTCRCEVITFTRKVTFSLVANRVGSDKADGYTIAYFGEDAKKDGNCIASIEEYRNGQHYATEVIFIQNGVFFLESYRID